MTTSFICMGTSIKGALLCQLEGTAVLECDLDLHPASRSRFHYRRWNTQGSLMYLTSIIKSERKPQHLQHNMEQSMQHVKGSCHVENPDSSITPGKGKGLHICEPSVWMMFASHIWWSTRALINFLVLLLMCNWLRRSQLLLGGSWSLLKVRIGLQTALRQKLMQLMVLSLSWLKPLWDSSKWHFIGPVFNNNKQPLQVHIQLNMKKIVNRSMHEVLRQSVLPFIHEQSLRDIAMGDKVWQQCRTLGKCHCSVLITCCNLFCKFQDSNTQSIFISHWREGLVKLNHH